MTDQKRIEEIKSFRKKPVVFEAVQWTGKNIKEVNQFLNDGLDEELREDMPFVIETLEGDHTANVGDWIIKGVKGEFYPCKPDIFEQTYEPATQLIPYGDDEGLITPEAIDRIYMEAEIPKAGYVENCKALMRATAKAQRDLNRQEIPEAVKAERERIVEEIKRLPHRIDFTYAGHSRTQRTLDDRQLDALLKGEDLWQALKKGE